MHGTKLLARPAEPAANSRRTIWSGVYTPAQAARGATAYEPACSRCHREDLSAYSGLRGAKFIENWREDNLQSLWLRISKTMPAGAPATLPETEYLDILAYLLQANDFPAGTREITADQIPGIRFEAKTGPEPVPDFALVQTVGCLVRASNGTWTVARSSDPVRTRNPGNSSPEELKAASGEPPGRNTFRILDASSLQADLHDGRRAKVKGLLIRKTNDERLNTTSVEVLAPACQ